MQPMIQAREACQAHCAQLSVEAGGGGRWVLAVGLPTPDICYRELPTMLITANLSTDGQLKAAFSARGASGDLTII